jgi:hypothetical protein
MIDGDGISYECIVCLRTLAKRKLVYRGQVLTNILEVENALYGDAGTTIDDEMTYVRDVGFYAITMVEGSLLCRAHAMAV